MYFFYSTMSLPSYTAWITRESISLFVKCLVHDQCGITDVSTAVIKISEYLRKSHKFNFCRKLIFYQYHLFVPCFGVKKRDKYFVNLVWCVIWRHSWWYLVRNSCWENFVKILQPIVYRLYTFGIINCFVWYFNLKKDYIPYLIIK